MNEKINPINIFFIAGVPIILLILIGILFYVNITRTIEIEATVTYVNKNYIIVKEKDSKREYKLKLKNITYKINDKLELTLYKINNTITPREATIKKVKLIKEENSTEEIEDNEIVNYIHDLNNDLDEYQQNKEIQSIVQENYKIMVDFLFYEGKINNKQINDLDSLSIIKSLKLAMDIDDKMNKILPEYKATLEEKYQNIKSNIIEKYLDTTIEVCKNDEETCLIAKNILKEIKDSYTITWNYIKNISEITEEKQKEWYEIWKQI